MSKRIIGIVALLGLTTIGLEGSLAKNSHNMFALEQVVSQEAVQQQTPAEKQRYADFKNQLDEANGIARCDYAKTGFEYNDFYKNICTVYFFNNVRIYKFNDRIMPEAKRWTKDGTPVEMPVVYKATKPGAIIPEDVKKRAEKGLTTIVSDENTPELDANVEYLILIKDINPTANGRPRGLMMALPLNPDNLSMMTRYLGENRIFDGIKF